MESKTEMNDDEIRDNIKEQERIRDNVFSIHKEEFINIHPRCCWINCITEIIDILPYIVIKVDPDDCKSIGERCKSFELWPIQLALKIRKKQWLVIALLHLGFRRNKRKGGELRYYGYLTEKGKEITKSPPMNIQELLVELRQ